jgi:hypothetical protein
METPRGLIPGQFGAETREDCGILVLVELNLCPFVSVGCFTSRQTSIPRGGRRINKHVRGRRLQRSSYAILTVEFLNALLCREDRTLIPLNFINFRYLLLIYIYIVTDRCYTTNGFLPVSYPR